MLLLKKLLQRLAFKTGAPTLTNADFKKIIQRFNMHAVSKEECVDIKRIGVKESFLHDVYHNALSSTWKQFTYIAILLYLLINVFFAVLYMAAPEQISGIPEHPFTALFFFSVQTLSTVGYGGMLPLGPYANIIVTIEVLVGMMINALAAGIVFARFARPQARIMFSNTAVIANENGIPHLSLRIANLRNTVILAVDVEASLSRIVVTESGHLIRQFERLSLIQSHIPVLQFTFFISHLLTPESPLYGKDLEALEKEQAEIVVTVSGTDETLGQSVFTRTSYQLSRIYHNHRFVDILIPWNDGKFVVDYSKFHEIEEHV